MEIALVVLTNGELKVRAFSFKFKLVIVAYVDDAVAVVKYEPKLIPIALVVLVNGEVKVGAFFFLNSNL
jgi:hypothetical protein